MANCLTCIHQEVCKERMAIFNCPNIACQYEAHELEGEWIENIRYKRKGKKFLDCSRCHYGENGDIICEVSKIPNYCPNCGAKMRKLQASYEQVKEGDAE